MRSGIFNRGLLCTTKDCAVDPVAAILAFARSVKIDGTALDCLG